MLPHKAGCLSSLFTLLWAFLLLSPTVNTLPTISIDVEIAGGRTIGEKDILHPRHYRVKCRCAQDPQLNQDKFHSGHSKCKLGHSGESQLLRVRGGSEAAFASASLMAANPQMAKQFFGSKLISQPRKIGNLAFLPPFPLLPPDVRLRQASPSSPSGSSSRSSASCSSSTGAMIAPIPRPLSPKSSLHLRSSGNADQPRAGACDPASRSPAARDSPPQPPRPRVAGSRPAPGPCAAANARARAPRPHTARRCPPAASRRPELCPGFALPRCGGRVGNARASSCVRVWACACG
jgi:hypothetical protein